MIKIQSMFLNNVSANGFNHEGMGSVLSFKLMSYGISRALGLKYSNNYLEEIIGYSYEGLTKEEYSQKLNSQFNFNFVNTVNNSNEPFDIFFDYPTKNKLSEVEKLVLKNKRDLFYWFFSKNIKKISEKKYIRSLTNGRECKSLENYYKKGKNIAIHLRSPRQDLDVRFEGSRNYFYGSFSDIDIINNIIRQIEHSDSTNKLNFHIVSTGDPKLFKYLDTMFEKNEIFLHLNTNIFDSFEILINADLLVATSSGLSYSAHLLNNNKTLIPATTNVGKRVFYKDSINLDEKGFIKRLNYKDKLF